MSSLKPANRSASDIWADHVRSECAKAVGAWLEGSVRLDRPIRSLTVQELENIAEAATSQWIVLASQRIAEAPADCESQKLSSLLLG